MARIETAGVPSATAASSNNLIGMRAIVTGANSGIGFCTARELVRRGANVTLACRSLNKGQEAADAINALDPFGEASCMELDLADLHSVKNFASAYLHQHDTCNILVNNAGLNTIDNKDAKTKQGFELCFGVNYLAHFYLTDLLLETLRKSGTKQNPSRVVNVSSAMHRFANPNPDEMAYKGRSDSYGSSKLYNIQHAQFLQERAKTEGWNLLAFSLHPGSVNSNIWRTLPSSIHYVSKFFFNLMFLDNEQGAFTSVAAATDPTLKGGEYLVPYRYPTCCPRFQPFFEFIGIFGGAKIVKPSKDAMDIHRAQVLAEFSLRLISQSTM